ncbi:DUF3870 domain-containing protein [Filobacillus milosensis]|uniref:DUF3870 domain-containing protein n=1 Tax=Filobacillus milosensis TaxID=94137 RepID=A0A4Y8IRM7_9BACI|nr:DUF3870 domain-containing protein [Filobacillus milosensis]TFB24335.1 DUF3870 domain-containing protein [Filobacillus milosensis]
MNTYFIAGHAKLPSGMAAQSVYDSLSVTVEVDKKYGVIIEASCTLATEHSRDYISQLLKGYSLRDGIDAPVQSIKEHYLGKAGNALASALKDLYKQYQQERG